MVSVTTQGGARWGTQLGSNRPGGTRRRDEAGFSMVVVAISMVAVAALALLAAKATLGTTSSSNDSASGNPEVALAESVQAQQSLSTALQAAASLGAGSGRRYGRISRARASAEAPIPVRPRTSPGSRQPSPRSPSCLGPTTVADHRERGRRPVPGRRRDAGHPVLGRWSVLAGLARIRRPHLVRRSDPRWPVASAPALGPPPNPDRSVRRPSVGRPAASPRPDGTDDVRPAPTSRTGDDA